MSHSVVSFSIITHMSYRCCCLSSGGGVVPEVSGTYLGCYDDDDKSPILDFAYEDETALTTQVK